MKQFSLAIHGGAGTILKQDMTTELEQAYIKGLEESLAAGYAVLKQGGSAINAVKAAIVVLEDNLLFNAGRGSVFTKKGVQEMDAAIMDGKSLDAGSVAGIRNVRNPIELAAEVMLNSNHVFLSGKGANDFAIKQGIKLEPDEYFFSQFRYDQWKEIRDRCGAPPRSTPPPRWPCVRPAFRPHLEGRASTAAGMERARREMGHG